jgi:hypothetical protein
MHMVLHVADKRDVCPTFAMDGLVSGPKPYMCLTALLRPSRLSMNSLLESSWEELWRFDSLQGLEKLVTMANTNPEQ